MKKNTYIYLCALLALLFSCQSEENSFPVQHPDSEEYITFTVGVEEVLTRAENLPEGYEAYDGDKHPVSMGVFGYHTAIAEVNAIFTNQKVIYKDTEAGKKWVCVDKDDDTKETPKQWSNYEDKTDFAFFGYMPFAEGAALTQGGEGQYTLSYPYSITGGNPYITASTTDDLIKNTPLISTLPTAGDDVVKRQKIKMKFDQVLTGFSFHFKLGEKMSNIRNFIVKSVRLYGMDMYCSGTANRTYTFADNKWTADKIFWTFDTNNEEESKRDKMKSYTSETALEIPYKNNGETDDASSYDDTHSTLLVNSTKLRQWGSPFLMIPSPNFTPTIEVTYDVVLASDNELITRENVVSTVVFNGTNFKYADGPTTGRIHPIEINIVPYYLYVLADKDQESGYIILE